MGLLTDGFPCLDEGSLVVGNINEALDSDGLPRKFKWRGGTPRGVSDHLPLWGSIVLRKDLTDV